MSPVRAIRVPVMNCALYRTWAAAVVYFVAAVSAWDGREVPGKGERFGYEERSPLQKVNYGSAKEESGHSSRSYDTQKVAQPVSYTYFSGDIGDALNSGTKSSLGVRQMYGLPFGLQTVSQLEKVVSPPRENAPIFAGNSGKRQKLHVAPHHEEEEEEEEKKKKMLPPTSRRTVKFPLNTVLPANSIGFDHEPYPGLLQAVNTFSDLTPSRKPNEGVLVTHNTVSLPATDEGVTTASRTTITNHGVYVDGKSYPYREFTEITHNTQGDRGSLMERTQRLRVHQGLDGDAAESYPRSETGRGGGVTRYKSARREVEEDDQHVKKGGKSENVYNQDRKYRKEAGGYRDPERDSSYSDENAKDERKFRKDKERHGARKEGKGKKYGEGRKRNKGQTTHGEGNNVEKEELIKSTKYHDEDDGGGEHEVVRGELDGRDEEKNGGNKDGKNKESNHSKKKEKKKKGANREKKKHRSSENGF